ncbi:MAG: DNA gyrase inhibitor YacG [Mariprofundaceae bacterium]|nr:DNA gyrase inhibitor YacG [Mariprofundaceae bacterium]
MTIKQTPFKCPLCKAPVIRKSEDFPFCSPRCKTIDLGNWASDAYSISEPSADDDIPHDRVIH